MIVKCEQCQTRFKIPDDKVTDKGVKVRCSKCGHTFRIFKDGSQTASASTGSGMTQQLPAFSPGSGDPFASFGHASDPTGGEATRPMSFTPGVEATKRADLKPLEPSFDAQKDLPRQAFESVTAVKPLPEAPPGRAPLRTPPPPQGGGDFAALFEAAARQPVGPGSFDPFAGFEPHPPPAASPPSRPDPSDVTQPRAAHPFDQTQPRARDPFAHLAGPPAPGDPSALTQPKGVDPYGDLFKSSPQPAPSDLFGGLGSPPPLPRGSPTQPAGAPLRSEVSTSPGTPARGQAMPTQTEAPAWGNEGTQPAAAIPEPAGLPTAQVPAFQPPEGHPMPSADDFFTSGGGGAPVAAPTADHSLLPDLSEGGGDGLQPDEAARGQYFDMPSRPTEVPAPEEPSQPLARIALKKVPSTEANPVAGAAAPAAELEAERPKRRVFSVVLNVAIASVLVVAVGVLGSIWLADGKLDRQSFTAERVKELFKTDDLVAFDISNGLYDTKSGRAVFFVRGEVENRGKRPETVKVRAELVEGDALVRAAEGLAGATPTPEELWSVGQGDDLDKLTARLKTQAIELKPGQKAAFLVPFYEYPRDLKTFRVRVKLAQAGPQTASR